jgi:hypothetical protein
MYSINLEGIEISKAKSIDSNSENSSVLTSVKIEGNFIKQVSNYTLCSNERIVDI